MLDLPKKVTDKALLEWLAPGCVIRTLVYFPDGESHFKRLIILTAADLRTVLATIATTTPIDDHNRHYRGDDVCIAAGQEGAFERETYIQPNRVFELDIIELQNNYNLHQLHVLGNLSADRLKNIIQKVLASKLVERKYIQRIRKDNGL
ncbi:MAG: hypothetical protein ABIH50_01655 [bacterium]